MNEYCIVVERQDDAGTWVPMHIGYWFPDSSPYQEITKFTAASMESMAVGMGLLTKRVVKKIEDGEEYEVTRCFTADGQPARFTVHSRPAPEETARC